MNRASFPVRTMGLSWPALQNCSRPVFRSRTPAKKVANIRDSLLEARDWFNVVTIWPGSSWLAARVWNFDPVRAIQRAPGTPFPETSPMQKNRRPSRRRKSYMSPPTALAGWTRPYMSRAFCTGKDLGSISIWMLRAISSSLLMAVCWAVVAFSSLTYRTSECCMFSNESLR